METRALLSTIPVFTPGSLLNVSGLPATLTVSADEFGHGSATLKVTTETGTKTTTTIPLLPTNLVNGRPVDVPGIVGNGTGNPLTLAYQLPAPVIPGTAVVTQFQSGLPSEVFKFTDGINQQTNSLGGWLLIYSDFSTTNPADSPADTFDADQGLIGNRTLPSDFNPFSGFNGSAVEFGVEGFDFAEYAANQTVGVGPDQAYYSILSDGNLVPNNLA